MSLNFGIASLESLLSGSHTMFKSRHQSPLSEADREHYNENKRKFQEGITILRKLRTRALNEQDTNLQQSILQEAHTFSSLIACGVISQEYNDKPSQIDPSFLKKVSEIKERYERYEADSGHALPPQFSVTNLYRAADDMLARIEEKAKSIYAPNHKLIREEMKYVLMEFLIGTNDLTINAIDKLFEPDTRVGGILTGGGVYTEMVKKIIERFGEPILKINTFVIAVNKEDKNTAFQKSNSDKSARNVIITDDMIDKGGTVITALWTAGEHFPNATIYSGKGTDYAGGFEKRRIQKYMSHLELRFQDFAELSEEGRMREALSIFHEAEDYARKNNVTLQPGWYKRKERLKIG